MGHRLISALILLNALGLVLCVVLITAAISSDDPARVAQVSEAVKLCLHLFVAGAALPTVAWGILAFEFDRSHSKKKLVESAIIYAVLIISLILFCIAGWRLPQVFITGLYITGMIPLTRSRERLPFPAKFWAPCTSLDRWTIRTIRSYGSGWGPDGVASPATRSGENSRLACGKRSARATVYEQYVGAYAGR